MTTLTPDQILTSLANLRPGAAPPAPASGNVSVYSKTDKLVYSQDAAGLETQMSSGGGGGGYPPVNVGQSGYATAYNNAGSPGVASSGLMAGALVQIGTGTTAANYSSDGFAVALTTSAALATSRVSTSQYPCNGGANPVGLCKFKMPAAFPYCRVWAGFSSTIIGPQDADNPTGAHAGVQQSDQRSLGENFQFMVKDGTTQTLVDSGVPKDALTHYVYVEINGASSIMITLYDASFVLQATTTVTTNLPTTAWNYQLYSGAKSLATSGLTWWYFFNHCLLRP